jgi:hypothetical protein
LTYEALVQRASGVPREDDLGEEDEDTEQEEMTRRMESWQLQEEHEDEGEGIDLPHAKRSRHEGGEIDTNGEARSDGHGGLASDSSSHGPRSTRGGRGKRTSTNRGGQKGRGHRWQSTSERLLAAVIDQYHGEQAKTSGGPLTHPQT